ncbi:MAG: 30S ribosomal protein S9 [Nitrososphaerota archaeon]
MAVRQEQAQVPTFYFGYRKTARALATIREGQGRVRVNGYPLELLEPEVARWVVQTPLELARPYSERVDIDVRTWGGGFTGQAYAAAMAIARALVGFFNSEEIKKALLAHDPHLLKGDPRQQEPKKFGGPGPRRRRQKSYR